MHHEGAAEALVGCFAMLAAEAHQDGAGVGDGACDVGGVATTLSHPQVGAAMLPGGLWVRA